MKKARRTRALRGFALGWPSLFFSFTFWALAIIISFCTVALIHSPSSLQSERVLSLISASPFGNITSQSTLNCPAKSNLVFNYKVSPVASNSCYVKNTNGTTRFYQGWFSCNKTLFPSRVALAASKGERVLELGGKFLCGSLYDLGVGDLEFVDVGDVQTGSGSNRCSSGYKECGATSSKIMCVKSSGACPVNGISVVDTSSSGSTSGKGCIFGYQIW